MALFIPIALGAGAYVLARKARQEQLAKDVAAQSKAAAGFGGGRRKKHHGGIHGDCPGCVGFGAVAARPAPPSPAPAVPSVGMPAPQRSVVVSASRPKPAAPLPPGVVATRTFSQPTYLQTNAPNYGVGWTAASAKAEGERIAARRDLLQDAGYSDDVVYEDGGGDDDVVYETGYVQQSYDRPVYGYGYGRRYRY